MIPIVCRQSLIGRQILLKKISILSVIDVKASTCTLRNCCMPNSIRCMSSKRLGINERRKIKSLNTKQDESTITSREKILRMINHNEISKPITFDKNVNDILDRASHRIQFMKNKLFQFWNPDYGKDVLYNRTGGVVGVGAKSNNRNTSSLLARPKKPGLLMDDRWWFWNIVFAMVPAIVISLYCELRAKPIMMEYEKIQQKKEMLSLMGPEFVVEYELLEQKIPKNYRFPAKSENDDTTIQKQIDDFIAFVRYIFNGEQANDEKSANSISVQDMSKLPIVFIPESNTESTAKTVSHSEETVVETTQSAAVSKTDNVEPLDNKNVVIEPLVLKEVIERINKLESILLFSTRDTTTTKVDNESTVTDTGTNKTKNFSSSPFSTAKSNVHQRMDVATIAKYRNQLDQLKKINAQVEAKTIDEDETILSKVLGSVLTIAPESIREGLSSIGVNIGTYDVDSKTKSQDIQNHEDQIASTTLNRGDESHKEMSHVPTVELKAPPAAAVSAVTYSSKETSHSEKNESISEIVSPRPWYQKLYNFRSKDP
jgi:hypothetical protein